MKQIHAVLLLLLCAVSGSAFAQTSPASGCSTSATPCTTLQPDATSPQGSGWVAPYGQPVQQKTRAQVYQELVHAQQDGQIAYLNRTVYAHH